jgi:hypothetical protein
MSQTLKSAIAVVGIDIGKNSFHVVGLEQRGASTSSGAPLRRTSTNEGSRLGEQSQGLPLDDEPRLPKMERGEERRYLG